MSSADLDQFFLRMKDYRSKIDDALMKELDRHKDSPFFNPLVQALKGGKRLRPILLVLSYEAVGGDGANPLPAAVAVELTHTESLVHDDIIDRAILRRDASTFHTLHGHEIALLSADFILSVILEITSRYKDPRIAEALAQATFQMSEGELLEIEAWKKRQKLTEDEYIGIVARKTASLFEASAYIGAAIGGAGKKEVEALSDFARMLGIVYQIQDDISDRGQASINIVDLLDTETDEDRRLEDVLVSSIAMARQKLQTVGQSKAKTLLVRLLDFVASERTETSSNSPQIQ